LKGRLRTLLEATTPEVKPTKAEVEVTDSEAPDVVANKPSVVEPSTGVIFHVNESATPELKTTKAEVEATDSEAPDVVANKPSVVAEEFTGMLLPVNQPSPKDIYDAVLPFILNHLEQPKDAKSLAESLDVRKGQIEDWLNRAVKEGKVRKTTKPVAYVANQEPALLSLLEKKDGT
jgi:predicted Rossmann fold nucleotide-binding protein DprA/Smf involved in DNA uptake